MFERFTDKARKVMVLAQEEARELKHDHIGTEHILLGLVKEGEGTAARVFTIFNIGVDDIKKVIVDTIGIGDNDIEGHIPFSEHARTVIEFSLREALQLGHNYISTEHILLGLLRGNKGTAKLLLEKLSLDIKDLRKEVIKTLSEAGSADGNEAVSVLEGGGRRRKESAILKNFGVNLTQEAQEKNLDAVIGREREIERIMQILSRRTKNNPVLIGEAGVGKTAVVEGLAQLIANEDVPDTLAGKQIYSIDLGSVVAGTRYRGDFEERLMKVIKEVKTRGDIILFIDEIHTLVGAGSGYNGALDGAAIIKPMLARGDLQTIGATTLDEYHKYFEKDAALERRFQPVKVEEPSIPHTIDILRGLRESYEQHHMVTITDQAIVAAANLSYRYIPDRYLPDKAIDLIDEAGAHLRIQRLSMPTDFKLVEKQLAELVAEKLEAIDKQDFEIAGKLRDKEKKLRAKQSELMKEAKNSGKDLFEEVDEEAVAEVLSIWTGVPVTRITEEETQRLLHMEEEIHKRVIGQEDAVKAISNAMRRTRAGLKDPRRPGGSFIFLGPSGVGKTELAKTLAEFLFDNEDAILSFDMSEYQEKHTVSRLVGTPPGYIGYDQGGQLTEAVHRKPFSVLLFDEVEKAHPDVFNTLLQVLEEGRLTDAQGRSVDFRNTIIIMTSNLGSIDLHKSEIGFVGENSDEDNYGIMLRKVNKALEKHFPPEFLNRIDETIVFHELSREEILKIVDLMLNKTVERMSDQSFGLEVTDAAKQWLADEGYQPEMGARPLRRAIQSHVEDALSERILFKKFNIGETVIIDIESNEDGKKELVFNTVAKVEPHTEETSLEPDVDEKIDIVFIPENLNETEEIV